MAAVFESVVRLLKMAQESPKKRSLLFKFAQIFRSPFEKKKKIPDYSLKKLEESEQSICPSLEEGQSRSREIDLAIVGAIKHLKSEIVDLQEIISVTAKKVVNSIESERQDSDKEIFSNDCLLKKVPDQQSSYLQSQTQFQRPIEYGISNHFQEAKKHLTRPTQYFNRPPSRPFHQPVVYQYRTYYGTYPNSFIRCFNCQKIGHLAKDCRSKYKKRRSNNQVASTPSKTIEKETSQFKNLKNRDSKMRPVNSTTHENLYKTTNVVELNEN